jgi:peptide-methionine (S)-S-oxide reductase
MNRQGHDVGTQYRSVIFCQEQSQAESAAAMILLANEGDSYDGKVVTQIVRELAPFYPAENYHQGYYEANPQQGYCSIVIAPKLAQFRARYPELLRQQI